MRRSLAKFSESEASNHTPSWADFTTTTPELKFRYTQGLALYRTPATKFDDLARRPTISCDRARSFVALVSTEGKSRLCEPKPNRRSRCLILSSALAWATQAL